MPHRIALITDSTCDIPTTWRAQYDISVVPLTIMFGDQSYLDGVDIKAEEFYERILIDKIHPTTSQPSPQAFLDAYRKAAENGAEEIIVFTISSAMSGTIQSARQAAEGSPIPVHIHDGRNNSMGLGWQVIAAARVRENGGSREEMLAAATRVRARISYYIALDTIDYLSKGGRINDAVRFLNSILQIKPLIFVKPEAGAVGASLPSRSRKNSIDSLYKEFFNHVNLAEPLHITVLHNNALDEAQALFDRVCREFSPQEIFISIVSPVLGVHTGPRAIALCGYSG